MAKPTKSRKKTCWQCGARLKSNGQCPKNCGPKALGDLFRLG